MGQWLSERLGQPFVIENRPGASSNIATEAVVRAPADGYTLLLLTAANAINTTMYEKLSFNLSRDIAPVASITRVPDVMVANLSVPSRTVPRVHRLCQGQSRQAHHGVGWDRECLPCLRRAVQVGEAVVDTVVVGTPFPY
jgi:tripartite-type tricarboxylate transporter receptor subunit TctC